MKYLYFFCFLLFFIAGLNAQNSGRGFSYQAVARGSDGQVKAKEHIEIQFTLLTNAQAVTASWQETQMATTDEFGIFSMTIGKGIKSGGTVAKFTDVNFAASEFWLKVELKDKGTWQEISKTQLLSVPYAEVAGNAQPAPTGSIIAFAGQKDKVPTGWLLCDGRELSRTDNAALYAIIGTSWGQGNGSTTFRLPDLRGLFLRGVSDGRHDDDTNSRAAMYPGGNTNNNVGSFQAESFRSHNHSGTTQANGAHSHRVFTRANVGSPTLNVDALESGNLSQWAETSTDGLHTHNFTTSTVGGNETRPDNAYVNYIIKL
ncbi:phage tail protein [Haliscomenobacter hydrossis]|uniref:Tail Collar domain protein n=1 Tax=Haliscomenobacter hydrossis (strain ATCC 27775 / DSM 1100 / LMG 10767 / O) TaxID=760192 RepID=F4KQ07_HALH1|nr:tail fiber protein [Haliscomenobacter hydrossis]AEE53211.1 Tail Collar domain protein [Haliscomenobacter hydrossis DSM 1100]